MAGPVDGEHYREHGWLVFPDAFDNALLEGITGELTTLCCGDRGPIRGGAPVAPEDSDAAVLSRHVALHFPHKCSPLVRTFVHHPWLVALFSTLLGPDVKVVQSMYFIRPPGGPGQAWHQDERFVPTRDRSLTGAWLALDDATVDNGCLWVIPGSHRRGIVWPHRPHGSADFDPVDAAHQPHAESEAVPLPVSRGTLIVFDGHLVHRSLPNRSDGFRRSLALHAARATSRMPWMGAEQRGPIGEADCRDFELICGEDPYADARRDDLLLPWLRPARLS